MESDLPILPPGDFWLNNDLAAKYVCTSVRNLERIRSKHNIPYGYFGNEPRYRKSALDDYINRGNKNSR
jgi:hypothetical protein